MNKYPILFNDNGWEYVSEWVNNNVTFYDVEGNETTYNNATHYSVTDGITTIEAGAFDSCESLVSITIPNEITSINGTAFATCPILTEIIISNSVTYIGGYAFYGCPELKTLIIPDSVTNIDGYAFGYCSSLNDITLPVMEYPNQIFSENTALTTIYPSPISSGKILKANLEVANEEYAPLVLVQVDIIELKDKNNNTIYPITSSEAVYMPDGTPIVEHLGDSLPINENYSVLHNGEFIDIEKTKKETTEFIYSDRLADSQAFELSPYPSAAPFYFNNMTGLQGAIVSEITYCPKNNKPLEIGLGDFKNKTDAVSKGVDVIKTWKYDFITITPNAEDYDKLSTFKLDGTDLRVVRNPDFVNEDGFMFIPDNVTIGFDKRTAGGSNDGPFGYTSGISTNGSSNLLFCGTNNVIYGPDASSLTFNFKTVEKVILEEGYEVPIIDKLNSKDISLDNRITDLESKITNSPLKGKNISFIGDSITTYSGYIPTGYAVYYPNQDVQSVDDTYWKIVIDTLGLNLLVNESWSGSQLGKGGYGSVIDNQRFSKLAKDGINPDIVVINIGTNDLTNNRVLGDYVGQTAVPSLDTTTIFSNAYGYMLSKVSENYPEAQIWCCTLATRDTGTKSFPETHGDNTIHDYNNYIRQIATAYGCKIMDLANCGITYWNLYDYMGDGLHPNKSGMQLYANQLIGQLSANTSASVVISSNEPSIELPINDKYSVLHQGEFTDLFEKSGETYIEYIGTLGSSISNPARSPFFINEMTNFSNKLVDEFTYIPCNNLPLKLGVLEAANMDDAITKNKDCTSWDFDFITITPNAEDYNKLTTFKLDGTDSRVVRNDKYVDADSGYMLIPVDVTIGVEERSNLAGAFVYSGIADSNQFNFFYNPSGTVTYNAGVLTIGFRVVENQGIIEEYVVPEIKEFDSRITTLEDKPTIDSYTKEESDNKYVFKEVTDVIGPNLFDKNDSDIVVGSYLNTSNYNQPEPTFTAYTQYICTGYIPAVNGDFITSSYIAWEVCGYFNADKEFIGALRLPFSHEQPYTIEIGNNTPSSDRGDRMRDGYTVDDIAFIRINIKTAQTVANESYTSLDECVIVKGNEYPNQYIPFGESLLSKEIAPNLIITDNNLDDASISASKIKDIPTSKSVTFAGKSVLITGDSITEASGFDGWVNNVRNICDFDNVYNDGKSGTGIITDFNSSVSIMDRYSTWETDYGSFDCIIINGNMNDTKTVGFEVGLFDDPTTDMNVSQYAACKALIEGLVEKYPLKQIIWIISTPRRNSYKNTSNPGLSTDFAWGINSFFEPYCTAIKQVCAHYGIPVLDLYHESGLRPYNDTFNTTYFVSADGTHPNEEAQKIMTSKIIPFIEKHLGENK